MMMTLKETYIKFRNWQKTPFEVAPLSGEDQECTTCGTKYKGNFCPRCGQSAKVESRMSLWKTLLLVLDVWGVGNRGMFRTLRDLILRPGYLICDYIQGKRSAYFPPFKMLFLLTTLSLVVGHGFNIMHQNYQTSLNQVNIEDAFSTDTITSREDPIIIGFFSWVNQLINFQKEYPAIFQLISICLFGFFFYIFFKNSKIIGKFTFSEFFIGLVYMVNMYIIYNVFIRFFGYFGLTPVYWFWLPCLYLIPLKQISGYSLWGTIWRSSCSITLGMISILFIMLLTLMLAILIYQ